MSRTDEILTLWFGEPHDDHTYYDTWHKRWFRRWQETTYRNSD